MPKVSIITALYNRSRYLRPRAQSILQQTFRDFEWIVIDDHSTDDTFERFDRLTRSDRRVLALRNAANIGQGPTTRKAVELARGDYVYLTDDDDLCEPTFLERMVALLDARPDVGLAYCGHRYIDGRGGTWNGWPPRRQSPWRSGAAEFRALLRCCHIQSPCSIIRRAAAERAGVFRTFVPPSYVDYHLCLKTCLAADVAFVAEPLVAYRIHADQATRLNLARADFLARQAGLLRSGRGPVRAPARRPGSARGPEERGPLVRCRTPAPLRQADAAPGSGRQRAGTSRRSSAAGFRTTPWPGSIPGRSAPSGRPSRRPSCAPSAGDLPAAGAGLGERCRATGGHGRPAQVGRLCCGGLAPGDRTGAFGQHRRLCP